MLKNLFPGMVALILPLPVLAADNGQTKVPPGTPVIITVKPAEPAAPTVTITLKDRHGHCTPCLKGCAHTGAGNIDVAQPSPDTVIITMNGAAVATAHPHGSSALMSFDLSQCLEVVFEKPEVKAAKVTLEGRVLGLLRGGKSGSACTTGGCAGLASVGPDVVTVCVPDHCVNGCDNLSLNDHVGPVSAPIAAGTFTLHQAWQIHATHPCGLLGKAAAAELAPDPAVDPLWLSVKEPFHGAVKKDLGFQIILKVAEDTSAPEPKK